MTSSKEQRHFWAKTTADGSPGLSVREHMLNVGSVAQCLAAVAPELLVRFHLQESQHATR